MLRAISHRSDMAVQGPASGAHRANPPDGFGVAGVQPTRSSGRETPALEGLLHAVKAFCDLRRIDTFRRRKESVLSVEIKAIRGVRTREDTPWTRRKCRPCSRPWSPPPSPGFRSRSTRGRPDSWTRCKCYVSTEDAGPRSGRPPACPAAPVRRPLRLPVLVGVDQDDVVATLLAVSVMPLVARPKWGFSMSPTTTPMVWICPCSCCGRARSGGRTVPLPPPGTLPDFLADGTVISQRAGSLGLGHLGGLCDIRNRDVPPPGTVTAHVRPFERALTAVVVGLHFLATRCESGLNRKR